MYIISSRINKRPCDTHRGKNAVTRKFIVFIIPKEKYNIRIIRVLQHSATLVDVHLGGYTYIYISLYIYHHAAGHANTSFVASLKLYYYTRIGNDYLCGE